MAAYGDNGYEWKKNQSGNPEGGNLPKRVRRSKNRRMVEKLREHEDVALENIGKSVRGQEVDKDCLQSSKWLLEKLVAFSTACAVEEDKNNNMKLKNLEAAQEDEEVEKEETTPKPARFQLTVVE
jgi:hypothetical protein